MILKEQLGELAQLAASRDWLLLAAPASERTALVFDTLIAFLVVSGLIAEDEVRTICTMPVELCVQVENVRGSPGTFELPALIFLAVPARPEIEVLFNGLAGTTLRRVGVSTIGLSAETSADLAMVLHGLSIGQARLLPTEQAN